MLEVGGRMAELLKQFGGNGEGLFNEIASNVDLHKVATAALRRKQWSEPGRLRNFSHLWTDQANISKIGARLGIDPDDDNTFALLAFANAAATNHRLQDRIVSLGGKEVMVGCTARDSISRSMPHMVGCLTPQCE